MKKYVAFLLIAALAAAFCGCVAEVPPALSVAPAESGESSAEIAVSSEPAVSEELSLLRSAESGRCISVSARFAVLLPKAAGFQRTRRYSGNPQPFFLHFQGVSFQP